MLLPVLVFDYFLISRWYLGCRPSVVIALGELPHYQGCHPNSNDQEERENGFLGKKSDQAHVVTFR